MSSPANEFAYLCELVKSSAAIAIDAQREYLMEARLSPVAQREGFASVSALIARLRSQREGDLHWKVVEAMTTNETSFFRDVKPFEALRKVVFPQLIQARQSDRKLNIWCGASSSGQEPYSMAILLREHFPALLSWDVRILASDISNEMLEKAKSGVYTQLEVNRGLPANLLIKYFKRHGTEWRLDENVRKLVDFRRINLAGDWPYMGAVDLVMLRNVMIYFPVETKKEILKGIREMLRPDGFLFLGTAETTISLDSCYKNELYENASYYRPAVQVV